MLVVFPPIFLVDTKLICDYNFVAPLTDPNIKINLPLQNNLQLR